MDIAYMYLIWVPALSAVVVVLSMSMRSLFGGATAGMSLTVIGVIGQLLLIGVGKAVGDTETLLGSISLLDRTPKPSVTSVQTNVEFSLTHLSILGPMSTLLLATGAMLAIGCLIAMLVKSYFAWRRDSLPA